MKVTLFKSLVLGVAAPLIVTGKALILTGRAVTTAGIVTKTTGDKLEEKWEGAADCARIETRNKKEAATLLRHQKRVSKLEQQLQKETDLFRASGQTVEV